MTHSERYWNVSLFRHVESSQYINFYNFLCNTSIISEYNYDFFLSKWKGLKYLKFLKNDISIFSLRTIVNINFGHCELLSRAVKLILIFFKDEISFLISIHA